MAVTSAPALNPFRSPAQVRPTFSSALPQPRFEASKPALPSASADLLRVYFGGSVPIGQPRPENAALISKAVTWYNDNVEQIPPLTRGSRKNHGVHLRMIGDVVGLLPAVDNARKAYWLYMDTFNGFESRIAPGKKDYRMYCHDSEKKTAAPGKYLLRNYGFHILVFAPNGAIEAFRRKTPPEANMNGLPGEDIRARGVYFDRTEDDYLKLQERLADVGNAQVGVPGFLSSDKYTRRVLKPGKDGNNAWNQQARQPKTTGIRRNAFNAWLAAEEAS